MLRDVMAKWHIAGGDWFHRQPPLPAVNGLRIAGGPRTPKNRKRKAAKDDDDTAAVVGPATPRSSTNEALSEPNKENGGVDGYVNGDSLDVDDASEVRDSSPPKKNRAHRSAQFPSILFPVSTCLSVVVDYIVHCG